jgi:hypothetical protein
VIQPGLAIPHVVLDGKSQFDVLLIRAIDGIDFPNVKDPVHACSFWGAANTNGITTCGPDGNRPDCPGKTVPPTVVGSQRHRGPKKPDPSLNA